MTLDALAKEIAAAAREEAKALTDAAKAEARDILSEAKQEAQAMHDQVMEKAERDCAQSRTETVASARQFNQKRLLIARREELDATRGSVREQVGGARLKGRADLLKALVNEAKGEADPDMVLRPVALDRSALQKIGGNFDIGDDVDGIGGFVLESADRSIVLDYRFDGRLDEAWVAALPTVNTALFGDE